MAKGRNYITAQHPERGELFAGFDPTVRFVVPRVAESRFSARLAPFKSRAEAAAALIAEGCSAELVGA